MQDFDERTSRLLDSDFEAQDKDRSRSRLVGASSMFTRAVKVRGGQDRLTSDAGMLPRCEAGHRLDLMQALAATLSDCRDQDRTRYQLVELRINIDIDSFPIQAYAKQPGVKYNGNYHEVVFRPLVASYTVGGDPSSSYPRVAAEPHRGVDGFLRNHAVIVVRRVEYPFIASGRTPIGTTAAAVLPSSP